jgi:gliding motility-associated-like protein
MSKYLLFLFLLFSFTSNAQQTAVQNTGVKKNNQSSFINVKTLVWDEQEPYVNGFARVLSNNKFAFINLAGKSICPVEFDGARSFSNHLAAVSKNNKWGFINEEGVSIIPIGYDIVFDFTTTVTGVFANKKWWLINNKGAVLQSLDITTFYGFKNGIAKINKDGRWGTVNTKGDIVFDGTYSASANNNFSPFKPKTPQATSTVTACPDNIDFEFGSFLNWQCYIGHVDSVGTTNVITVAPSPPTANRHTLYSRILPSPLDPFGLFPINPPDGSNYALRLGNTKIGAEAERVRYTIHVPANDSNFSIKYDYAVVFQDPGHTIWTQPRFTVRVFDSAANSYVSCASFEYISTSNLPGFARSTVDTGVMYKPWSSVFLSLRGRAGKTMYLEFTTADCVRKGHWGYAYVDVEKPCGQSVEINYQCDTPHVTTLTGPVGFQYYNWWDSAFSTIIATGQNVTLNPGPAIGTTFWLEMIPYNNFGCTDTLPVRITGTFNADFTLSDTTGLCAPHTFTFYNNHIPSTSAIWDFGDGTFGSGDTVSHTYNLPGNYIVKLNAVLPSGCIGEGIKLVTVMQPTGSFSFDQTFYCNSQTAQFDAVVTGTDSLFWNFGDGTTLHTLQTTVFHTYTTAGIYIPTLTVQSLSGCQSTLTSSDTIKVEILRPGFKFTDLKTCGNTTVNFTDTSYSYFGISTRQWKFGDGTSGTGANVSHTYNTPGTYNVRLIITGISGCVDTIIKPVTIVVYAVPVASISGDTLKCQSSVVTFTSNVVSADAINYYRWTSSNGFSGNAANITIPFNTAGTFTVQLIAGTVHGCYDTTTHQIVINPTPDVTLPPNQDLCNGDQTAAINFSGSVSGTVYNWTNTGPIIGLASSGTGNIAPFTASSNGNSTATAGITVKPTANGCPGPSKIFTITVHPTPTVVQPVNQLLCNGSSTNLVSFTGAVTGTTFNWINSNPAIGLPASGTGDISSFIAVNNTNAPISATITVSPEAGNCPGAAKTFTITVNPTPGVNQPADQQLCNGSTTAAINFAGNVGTATYNWTNSNPSIGLASSGSGNIAAFTALTNASATTVATITVNPTANGCAGPTKTFTITVNPIATVNQPANQVLCNGSNTSAISFTGLVPGTVYQWTNSNASIGLPLSGSGDISSFAATNTTGAPVTATITVTPVTTDCPGASKTFTITVNPTPGVNQPADQQLCNGSTTAAINFAGNVGTATYNWTNSNPSIGLAASGSGNIAAFTALTNTSATTVATITVNPTANGCAGPTKTFTITVNPIATVNQPANQVLCNGSNTSAISFTGLVPGTVYQWTNSNASIGLPLTGSGNISSFAATNTTGAPITATITVTPVTTDCSGAAKTFTITVNPTPDALQPANQQLCSGSMTNAINFTGAVNSTVYNWTNSNPSIGLAASGSGNIAAFAALTNPSSSSSATIVVKPIANGCSGTDKTFVITVNPVPTVNQPASQTICNGGTINGISFTGLVPGATYKWVNNNTAIGLPASGTGDINSFTGINKTANPIIATIIVTPVTTDCPGAAKTFTIAIQPTPNVVATNSAIVCLGKPVQLAATGAVQYSWTPVDHLSCTNCSNPVSQPIDSIQYKVKGTSVFGCIAYDSVMLSVIKPFNMQVSPNDTLCIGESTGISATNAARYLWSPSTGLNRPDIANPTVKTNNTTTFKVVGYDNYNCFTDTGSVTIVVGPKPYVNLGPDRTLSTGTPLNLNAITQNGPIIKWEWTPASELSCNNCPNPSTTVKNNSYYSVVVTNNFGCTATDTLFINSMCKSVQVFIPNAFSPDGDGLNDIFMIRGRGITVKSFRIFNRWGEMVFEKQNFFPDDPKFGWDGKVKGVPATPDVFVYTAEIFCDNGIPYTYKGNVTILK